MNKQNIITPRCLYDVSFPSPSRDGKKCNFLSKNKQRAYAHIDKNSIFADYYA